MNTTKPTTAFWVARNACISAPSDWLNQGREVPRRGLPWHDTALVWLYVLVVLAFSGVMVLAAVVL